MKERNVACPICRSSNVSVAQYSIELPVSSAILHSSNSDRTPSVEFELAFCGNCEHGFNSNRTAINSDIYSSPKYIAKSVIGGSMSAQLNEIYQFIVNKFDKSLADLSVLEIGSGNGALAKCFGEFGAKVETIDPCVLGYSGTNIKHHCGFFDSKFSECNKSKFDLVIARHFVEHAEHPVDILKSINSILKSGGAAYIEVPNFAEIFERKRFFDLFCDHLQYFSTRSIEILARNSSFTVAHSVQYFSGAHVGFLLFDDALITERGGNQTSGSDIFAGQNADSIMKIFHTSHAELLSKLSTHNKILLYGAGAHCTTLVSWLPERVKKQMIGVMDGDLNKFGKYINGINVPVSTIDTGLLESADAVLNTAVLYNSEIAEALHKIGFGKPIINAA